MREAAEKEMNRFSRVSDYDVRRVVGYGPKPVPRPVESASPLSVPERSRKLRTRSASLQASLDFPSVEPSSGGGSA